MTENSENLTSERERILSEVEEMVLSAISARCACSNAKFRPHSIARAVATGRVSEGIAKETAERFANCPGMQEEPVSSIGSKIIKMCHYPPHAPSEA